MAKNSKTKLIGLGLTALVIVAGIITSFVWTQADVKAVGVKTDGISTAVGVLKEEGCKPADKNKLDVALMQKDISTIQTDIADIKTKQKEGFQEILAALKK